MFDYESLFIVSLPLYSFFLVFQIWKKRKISTIFSQIIFFIYVQSVVSITLLPLPFQKLAIEIGKENQYLENNFVPFRSLIEMVSGVPLFVSARQIVGNIALFLPFGFFAPVFWKDKRVFVSALTIGFFSSLGIEAMQFFISLILGFTYKITDVDDVALNTLGFICGYFLFRVWVGGGNWRQKENI